MKELGSCKECGKEIYEVTLDGTNIKTIWQRNNYGSSPHKCEEVRR